MFGTRRTRASSEDVVEGQRLTAEQRRVRDRLDAYVGPADGCRWGEVFMYSRGPDGTTRVLVGPDGTLLERTAWPRPRR
jgi:hypothetical protein